MFFLILLCLWNSWFTFMMELSSFQRPFSSRIYADSKLLKGFYGDGLLISQSVIVCDISLAMLPVQSVPHARWLLRAAAGNKQQIL